MKNPNRETVSKLEYLSNIGKKMAATITIKDDNLTMHLTKVVCHLNPTINIVVSSYAKNDYKFTNMRNKYRGPANEY